MQHVEPPAIREIFRHRHLSVQVLLLQRCVHQQAPCHLSPPSSKTKCRITTHPAPHLTSPDKSVLNRQLAVHAPISVLEVSWIYLLVKAHYPAQITHSSPRTDLYRIALAHYQTQTNWTLALLVLVPLLLETSTSVSQAPSFIMMTILLIMKVIRQAPCVRLLLRRAGCWVEQIQVLPELSCLWRRGDCRWHWTRRTENRRRRKQLRLRGDRICRAVNAA